VYSPALSVVLRLSDSVGISYWCVKIDPAHGRPDLRPARPWAEMSEGDTVMAADGETYEVNRLVILENAIRDEPAGDLLPACREVISQFSGRSYDQYAAALSR